MPSSVARPSRLSSSVASGSAAVVVGVVEAIVTAAATCVGGGVTTGVGVGVADGVRPAAGLVDATLLDGARVDEVRGVAERLDRGVAVADRVGVGVREERGVAVGERVALCDGVLVVVTACVGATCAGWTACAAGVGSRATASARSTPPAACRGRSRVTARA